MVFRSNEELVEHLIVSGVLKSPVLQRAFLAIDRKYFVPINLLSEAYADYPLPIGMGQTISQPTTVAFMLELLQPQLGQNVLEIGAGSGYVAALLSQIVGLAGKVTAIEKYPELVKQAQKNLAHFKLPQLNLITADGKQGYLANAPYDRIIVSAAAPAKSKMIEQQLKDPGRLVAPIGVGWQDIVLTIKKNTQITYQHFSGFVFVPLV